MKSQRHNKITGDFSEHLILYLLSKYNYEPVLADYTGIDIIAYNKKRKDKIGISVKSRSRSMERPNDGVLVDGNNYKKIVDSCKFFDCKPWMCFIIDRPSSSNNYSGRIYLFLLNLEVLCEYYPNFKNNKGLTFSMTDKWIKKYERDNRILGMDFSYTGRNW